MKKITFLLFLLSSMAIGQTPQSMVEFAQSGLTRLPDRLELNASQNQVLRSESTIVATYTDRATYLEDCSNGDFLTLEDFAGGPNALLACGEVISAAGGPCYPAGELQEGFEISVNTAGNTTIYIDPNDGFGTSDPAVGSNTFLDFTIITFTGEEPVTSVGFDVYSLLGGSNVDVRVIGEAGLIDTITMDVTTTGPVFLGIVTDEPILSIELEDLTGANVELISQFLFGACGPAELNDDPETAASLTVGEVFEDFPQIGDTTEATATAIDDPSCGNFADADLWYSFVVPESGSVTVESQEDEGSAITDTGLSIYEGEIGSLTEVVCNDDGGVGFFSLAEVEGRTPGEILYARVWEFGGGTLGTIQIAAYDTPPPANDDPEGAIALQVGSVFADFAITTSNVSATDTMIDDPSCANYGGSDVWFTVVPPSTGQVIIEVDTAGGITDTGMSIYTGEIGALVELECNDDGGNGLFSLVSLTDQDPAAPLFIRVWEFGGNAFGPFQIAAYSDCSVDGGTIAVTGTGETEVSICVGDNMPDPIEVTLGGDGFGANSAWIITDVASGEILGLPAAPPFDLDGLEPGLCAIYYISFEDDLAGLDLGLTIQDLEGCFDLSNPILVDRINEGGVCVMCEYTLQMFDSFGDGWNGGLMDVLVDGVVVLDDVSLDSDPTNDGSIGSLTFPVNSTAEITTVFILPGDFPIEITYSILDAEGNVVATGDVNTNVEPNTLAADCPTCLAPSNLLAANVTETTADLSWTDGNNPTAPEFTLEFGPAGFELGTGTIETGITTTSFMLTELDSGVEFEFYVTANCAPDDVSNTAGPIAFVTLPPAGDCSYTLEMNDSFGDGWNGATMDVLRNGVLALNNVSLDDDPNNDGDQGVLTFEILPGDDITTVFEDGGDFPGEVSYRILDSNFTEVASGDVNNNVETGTVTGECPTCFAPFDLAAGNFAPGSVDLTWSMPMAAFGYNWEIQDVGVAQGTPGEIASGNTLGDTFDTALGAFIDGNMYTFFLQADCTEGDLSIFNSIDFLYFLPPSNDDCENATEIFCDDVVTGSTTNANDSGGNPAGDVFFTYTPEDDAQDVTLSLCDGGTNYDSFLRVFDDECALTNEIAFNDDFCALQSELSFFAAEGTTYTIMVEGFGANVGNFSLALTCQDNLSVESPDFNNFTFYPNPAQERINLDAQQSIEQVTIFNLLGQQVLNQKIGVASTQLDVSQLATGSYIMQVVINGQQGIYQVIKQ